MLYHQNIMKIRVMHGLSSNTKHKFMCSHYLEYFLKMFDDFYFFMMWIVINLLLQFVHANLDEQ